MTDVFPFARSALAAAVLALGACAPAGWLDGGGDRRAAWLDYLGGVDLRGRCEDGETDSFRLVYRESDRADINVLDVLADDSGGAQVRRHRVGPVDLAGGAPVGEWRDGGDRSTLSPRELSALIVRLDQMGMFTPQESGPEPPAGGLSWLISGCLNGAWFLNVYLPRSGPAGVEVRFGPDRGGGLSGRARPSRWADGRAPAGSVPAAPAGTPMASLAGPEAVR